MMEILTTNRLQRVVVILTLVGLSFVSGHLQSATARLPGEDCPLVVRVDFTDSDHLRRMAGRLDIWSVDRQARTVVVGCDSSTLQLLRAEGETVIIDRSMTRRACAPVPKTTLDGGIPGFPCYRTIDETLERAADLAQKYPELVELVDIGDSWEREQGLGGNDLVVLLLSRHSVHGTGTPADPGSKPRLFAMASIHAREYATAELLLRFAESLVEGYGVDADATWILDEHEIHLLLYANPDGRERAQQGILWRKNANNEFCTETDHRGIDLNRNFQHQWGCCNGSSTDECSNIFRGPAPASEPETVAIQSYLQSIFPEQWDPVPGADATGIFLDIHSFGELIIWPWGFAHIEPPNGRALTTFGRKMAWFNGYQAFQGVDLYPTDGNTVDFAYGNLGVAAYTFELGTTFFEDCDYFEAGVVDSNIAALTYAAKVARTPYATPAGPDVVSIDGVPSWVRSGTSVVLRVQVSDSLYGEPELEPEDNISQVQLWIDDPPWRAEALPASEMFASDGAFDEPIERAHLEIPTSNLSPGRHTLFIQATDEAGNTGAVRAAFLWIDTYTNSPRSPGGRNSP